jgi:hypothetical protein
MSKLESDKVVTMTFTLREKQLLSVKKLMLDRGLESKSLALRTIIDEWESQKRTLSRIKKQPKQSV